VLAFLLSLLFSRKQIILHAAAMRLDESNLNNRIFRELANIIDGSSIWCDATPLCLGCLLGFGQRLLGGGRLIFNGIGSLNGSSELMRKMLDLTHYNENVNEMPNLRFAFIGLLGSRLENLVHLCNPILIQRLKLDAMVGHDLAEVNELRCDILELLVSCLDGLLVPGELFLVGD